MTKTITIFGATGNQGGSLCTTILSHPTLSSLYTIRAITHDPSKPAAQALAARGCTLVSADLNAKDSLHAAIAGSDTVFLVTDYWASTDPEMEGRQGRNVVDVCREEGVGHFVFSSLINVTEASNGEFTHVKHFDSKNSIEQYALSAGLPSTFVLPGYFMSNYLTQIKPSPDNPNTYTFSYPLSPRAQIPLLDPADFGKFVAPALLHPDQYLSGGGGKHIYAAVAYYPLTIIGADFEAVTGKKLLLKQVSEEEYMARFPERMAREMLENHFLMEEGEVGYFGGKELEDSLRAVEEAGVGALMSWREWVAESKFGGA